MYMTIVAFINLTCGAPKCTFSISRPSKGIKIFINFVTRLTSKIKVWINMCHAMNTFLKLTKKQNNFKKLFFVYIGFRF